MDENKWYCPIADREISEDICYEVMISVNGFVKPESVPEVDFKRDEKTVRLCRNCPHSDG